MSKQIKPYGEAFGDKKSQVSRMFNAIAPHYDFLNRLLSLGVDTIWRRRAISCLREHHPKLILDVATGTADLAIESAVNLKPGKVIGIDISNQMLEIGRQKLRKQGLDTIVELREGDSENLPFANDTFDAVTVAFGVRNFEHLDLGLAEMHRVLKDGGQLVILEFSKPRLFPFKQLFNGYFRYLLPAIGRFTSKDPKAYKYLFDSVQAFPYGDDFLKILKQTGYKSSQCPALTLGICSIYSCEK